MTLREKIIYDKYIDQFIKLNCYNMNYYFLKKNYDILFTTHHFIRKTIQFLVGRTDDELEHIAQCFAVHLYVTQAFNSRDTFHGIDWLIKRIIDTVRLL